MIINVRYGGSADAAARYIEGAAREEGKDVPGTEDRARLLGSEGFGFPVQDRDDVQLALDMLRRDVELQASNTKPVENTVIHASMSWEPGYEPSREEMREAADHLAKAWGMEAHRRISWSHDDKAAKDPESGKETGRHHTHTIFGSIHPDTGYAHHDHELNDRAQRAAIDWERIHGIPPTRQKDHDKAAAAEASDHARTMDLSRNTDGSILRRSLDRALSLGGRFGPDKTAQRNEFIKQNDLTKFPQHTEQAYAPPEVAREKRDYIRDNREASSGLTRAYKREAKERERGVSGLYEDHGFEKTSKPPTQKERERDMGRINDALDWPWNKASEIIKRKWQEKFPSRDFGKEVEEKGWDHPEVKRQWEKRYGPAEYGRDEEKREANKAQTAEEVRVRNWKTQRERRDKEEGHRSSPSEAPPWSKEEQRSEAWRQKKEREERGPDSRGEPARDTAPRTDPHRAEGLDRITDANLRARELEEAWKKNQEKGPGHPEPGEVADEIAKRWSRQPDPRQPWREKVPPPLPLDKEGKERIAKEMSKQVGQETPALPRPQEIPMPKIEPRDRLPEEKPVPIWRAAREIDEIAKEKLAKERENLTPQQRKEIDNLTPEQKQANIDRNIKEFGDEWRRLAKEEREGRGPSNPQEPTPVRDKNKDTRTPQQIEQDEYGMTGKQIPENSQEIENKHRQRAEDYHRDEEPKERSQAPRPSQTLPQGRDEQDKAGRERAEREEQGRELPRSPPPVPDRETGKDRAEREEQGQELPRSPGKESRADGTTAQGRQDRTQAGQPGILPGGSHEHGSPSQQFRRQLDESLRKIRIPEREIGKDKERER